MTSLLEIQAISMRFGGIQALENISFSIKANSITALIGPNGAGKTTLFNCLTGFYTASSGQILFHHNGRTICLKTLLGKGSWQQPLKKIYYKWFGGSHAIARVGIARTFQNIRLFKDMSVVENLLVAQHQSANRNMLSGVLCLPSYQRWEKQAIAYAYDWLDIFGLVEQANYLAGQLSYGQQRHLEIARALCTRPSLLCLDEPAAGLNPHETDELSEKILMLREQYGITLLLIEHDMSMVMKISDNIIVLDNGQMIAEGSPADIPNNPKVIEAYLG